MKKLLVFLFLILSLSIQAVTKYISPSGSDGSGTGTITQPWFSLNKAWSTIAAGDIIYIRGGTYNFTETQVCNTTDGTSGNHIRIENYPGEVPIFKFTGMGDHVGLRPTGISYVDFKGIVITEVPEDPTFSTGAYGIFCYNTTFCTFTQMTCKYIGGWGIALQNTGACTDLLFKNCDSYNNFTPLDAYDGGDGFQSGGSSGTTRITLDGCRFYWNGDDGVDLRKCEGLYTVINCWSFMNGYRENHTTHAGNGMGYKMGTVDDGGTSTTETRRLFKNNLSFYNYLAGYDDSDDGFGYMGQELYNNVSYANAEGFNFNYDHRVILRNNVSYNQPPGVNNDNFRDTHSPSYNTHDHNSWNGLVTVTAGDFVSVDTSGVRGARQADGSLPVLNFLKLAAGSDLIDAGVNVGTAYAGAAPDMGAFEYGASGPVLMTAFTLSSAGNATTIVTYHGTLQFSTSSITPSTTTDQTFNWSVSSGTGSATISSSGLLTAVTDGTVTVRADAHDGSGVWTTKIITISNQVVSGYATVITTIISQITKISAVSGGNVTSDGGSAVTDKGICWSLNANPTTSDSHVHAGTGIGSWASSLSGLTESRTYHVRAFATNSSGTSYGADRSFETRAFQIVVN